MRMAKTPQHVIFTTKNIPHIAYCFRATLPFSTNNSILKSCAKWAVFSEPVTNLKRRREREREARHDENSKVGG